MYKNEEFRSYNSDDSFKEDNKVEIKLNNLNVLGGNYNQSYS